MGALELCEPVVQVNFDRTCDVKGVILKYIEAAKHGIFFTRNIAGDLMTNIFRQDGIDVDICYDYEYFEIFGLTKEEQIEIERFYCHLNESWRASAKYPKKGWV